MKKLLIVLLALCLCCALTRSVAAFLAALYASALANDPVGVLLRNLAALMPASSGFPAMADWYAFLAVVTASTPASAASVASASPEVKTDGKAPATVPPVPGSASPVCRFTVDAAQLLSPMKLARVSVANDDLRPQMSCVCLDVYHDKIIVVSSDGHSLYKETVNLGLGTKWLDYGEFPADGSARLLAHKSKLQALDNAFRGLNQITVTADTSMLQFSADGVCLVFRQVDQKYPNYDSVIPKNPPHRLVCDRRDLVSALRRVSLFGDDSSNLVRLSVAGGALMLQAEDYDFAKSASETVALSECQCQDGFAIGCKCAMFIALLGCIQTDSVVLLFTDPTRAFLMREADEANSSRVCLQMPMLLNG